MLTKKYVYGSLALAVMLACGSAQAKDTKHIDASTEDYNSADDVNYTGDVNYGIYATAGKTVNLTGKNINFTISGSEATDYVGAFSKATGGIGGGLINLGGENTQNITLNVTNTSDSDSDATGIWVHRKNDTGTKPSKTVVTSKNLTINAYSENGSAVGLWVQNSTIPDNLDEKGKDEGRSTVIINAENTVINVSSGITEAGESGEYKSKGIVNYSQGKVEINNNLTINAGTAISTRGYAETKINEDGKGTVKINGNINFDVTNDGNSGKDANATVNINLTNKDSYLNGNIMTSQSGSPDGVNMTVTNMVLSLKNGGTWNTNADSFVNNLTLDGGIINAKNANQTITVGKLSGTGDINLAATTDGNTIKTSTINITGDVSEGSHLNANLTGITADDIKDADKALESIKGNVSGVAHSNTITEGDINGAITQNVDAEIL